MENEFILVTGGAGSVGSELVRQLAPKNNVYIIDNNETAFFDLYEELENEGIKIQGKIADIRDENTFKDIPTVFGFPTYIFHAAALKHVTPSEWYPMEYVKTNILGTQNVLNFAKNYGCVFFVNISTDKVVNAESIMGITKKVAEKMVKNVGHISVRFGNVMGSRGSVLPIWQKQVEEGKPITVTDERMERYMMTIPQACELVIQAAKRDYLGKVLVLEMGKQINILQLAKEIIQKSGRDIPIKTIGVRKGETLSEKLMTEEEQKSAKKEGNYWILE